MSDKRVPDPWESLGLRPGQIEAGLGVMVAYTISAAVNGDPPLICYARAIQQATPAEAAVFVGEPEVWWLDVYTAPGVTLPQMFRVDQILGVPAIGIEAAYI